MSGGRDDLPPAGSGMTVRPEHRRIHDAVAPDLGPHIMTGPVAVRGAEPGDALRIEILDVALREDWGFNLIRPGAGTLPDRFPDHRRIHLPIDRAAGTVLTPWGLEIPARPFFGVMGTAPPPHLGRLTSIVPGAFGGNIDNKELVAGATLYLPVWTKGALFSAGDGHAAQGDGEVCGTAIESPMDVTLKFELVKGADLAFPRFRTRGPVTRHLDAEGYEVTTGVGPDLMEGARAAVSGMIDLLTARHGMSAVEAYMLCSVCGDLRVSEIVDMPNWVVSFYFPRVVLS